MSGGPNYDTAAHRRWDEGTETGDSTRAGDKRLHAGPHRNLANLNDPRQMALLPDPQGDLFDDASNSLETGRWP